MSSQTNNTEPSYKVQDNLHVLINSEAVHFRTIIKNFKLARKKKFLRKTLINHWQLISIIPSFLFFGGQCVSKEEVKRRLISFSQSSVHLELKFELRKKFGAMKFN